MSSWDGKGRGGIRAGPRVTGGRVRAPQPDPEELQARGSAPSSYTGRDGPAQMSLPVQQAAVRGACSPPWSRDLHPNTPA